MSLAGIYRRLRKLLIIGLLPPVLFAQAAPRDGKIRNGVYTAEQARQGKAIYQDQCGMCHGDALEGRGPDSALAGSSFLNSWTGQTIADLFMKTIVMMPATNPGTLTPKQTADVIAYILSTNKFPAGKAELPTDPQSLEMIHIIKP
jgi:S-disulfanyl-L-cysteine oxidoreductase SoxD